MELNNGLSLTHTLPIYKKTYIHKYLNIPKNKL